MTVEIGEAISSGADAIGRASAAWLDKRLESFYGRYLDQTQEAIGGRLSDEKRIDKLCDEHSDARWSVESSSAEVRSCVTTAGAIIAAAGQPVPQGPGKYRPIAA